MLQIKIKSPQQAIVLRNLIYNSGQTQLAEVLWQLDDHLRDFEELMQNGIQIKALNPKVDIPEPSGVLSSQLWMEVVERRARIRIPKNRPPIGLDGENN